MEQHSTDPARPVPPVSDASAGDLAVEVARDVSTLFRQEVALAKAEIRQEVKTAGVAAGAFGGAGFAGYFVLVFLSLALMYGLDAIVPIGWAAVIVAAVWAVIGVVLAIVGRRRLRQVGPPEREDMQWAKNRSS